MRLLTLLCASTLALFALSLCLQAAPARAAKGTYTIGAVLDITGTGSPLGTPESDTLKMLEKQINAKGGVNGHPVRVIIYDNASEEAKSVTAVKKLIESDHVLAIIGSSQTGTTLATADTVQSAKVPMISCAAGVNIVQPVKPWIFKTA
jgi:branched-chain amino acid transport system substrate-binding protein